MKRLLTCLALVAPLFAASNDSFLLRNVTVHPISGPDLANGSILVVDGKIAEVGLKITAPKGIKVIDGKGTLHAYPGMIDSATEVGLAEIGSIRETNDTGELGDFNPQLNALVAINPESEHIPVTRANGTTTVMTLPGTGGRGGRGGGANNIITGQATLVHLDGWTWEEMQVRRSAAMQLVIPTLSTGGGRGGGGGEFEGAFGRVPFAEARRNYEKRLSDLQTFMERARRYQKAKTGREPGFRTDLKFEAMLPVLEGKTPLFINATRERAIKDAIAFADKEKVKVVIAGPRDFGDTLPELKAKGIPVITGPTLELPLDEDDPYDAAFTQPAEIYKAGVKFAFASFNNQFARNLPYQAGTAVAFGLPKEEALKAVTINAAEIWGVSDQIGSIDKGKWADLMITDGDPLETTTQVKYLYIKGKNVDLSSKHTKLYEKYLNRP